MAWYVVQLVGQLLLAFLVGLATGWLLWRWGWKKHVLTQEHEVTRLRLTAAERAQTIAARDAELATLRAAQDETSARLVDAERRAAEAEVAARDRTAAAAAAPLVIDLRDRPEEPDDLARIEGIGPKMAAALVAAGIRTFARLAVTDEATLRAAISQAGMSFAPSLVTWGEQAGFLARGDEAGFVSLTDRLTAGRAPEQG